MGFYFLMLVLVSSISPLNATKWLEKWKTLKTNYTDLYRENNILLYGVDQKEDEDLLDTVREVGYHFGISRPWDDVEKANRLECTKRPRPLIIKLKSLQLKRKWIQMFQLNNLWKKNWFVYDHLPKEVWMVYQETRKWVRAKNYTRVWVNKNEVFYRKNDTCPMLKVVDLDHLEELKWDEYHYEVHGDLANEFRPSNHNSLK
uniref:Uncharacterized protein n=1 Tax=Cacopsylla melanoneura TaxID=428564 RepID=A0A8D8QMG6_9HEMI